MGILYYHTDLRPFMNGNGLSVRGTPKVPFMETTVIRSEAASGLLQRYETEDLILRYDCFDVQKETSFLPDCRSPVILYYVLEGNAYGIHQTAADPVLDVHRHYLRGAEHINGGKFVLTEGRYRCFYIGLPEKLPGLAENRHRLFPSDAPTRKRELKLIEEILHCTYIDTELLTFLQARVLDLWQPYSGHPPADLQTSSPERHQLRLLPDYIGSHLGEKLSDSHLAQVYGCSVSMFRKEFLRHFGQPPHKYVLTLRMEKAKELLLQTHKTIEQIASEIGYADAPPFYREFRRYFHYTPNDFRRHNRY